MFGRVLERGQCDFHVARIRAQSFVQCFQHRFFCRPQRVGDEGALCCGCGLYARTFGGREKIVYEIFRARFNPFQIRAHRERRKRAQRVRVRMTEREIEGGVFDLKCRVRHTIRIICNFNRVERNDVVARFQHYRLHQTLCRPAPERPFLAALVHLQRRVFFHFRVIQKPFRFFLQILRGFDEPVNHSVTFPGSCTVR